MERSGRRKNIIEEIKVAAQTEITAKITDKLLKDLQADEYWSELNCQCCF